MELCWLITNRCNANCRFCHFFEKDKYKDKDLEENLVILDNIFQSGIKSITWSGGEAFQYPGIQQLLLSANNKDIYNTLITNGYFPYWLEYNIFKLINQLVISIDSSDDRINKIIGRNDQKTQQIEYIIEQARIINPAISIRINTVLNSYTISGIKQLADYLINLKIDYWRISKFVPLRGRALNNKDEFEISDFEYYKAIDQVRDMFYENIIQTRKDSDFESEYILIVPNGKIIQTQSNNDQVIGSAFSLDDVLKVAKKLTST